MSTKKITSNQIAQIEITPEVVMHILRHFVLISAEARSFLKEYREYLYTNKLNESWIEQITDDHIDACLNESGLKFIGVTDPYKISKQVIDAIAKAVETPNHGLEWNNSGKHAYACFVVPDFSLLGSIGLVEIDDSNRGEIVQIERGNKKFNGIHSDSVKLLTTTDVVVQLFKRNEKVILRAAYTGMLTQPQSDQKWWSKHAFVI